MTSALSILFQAVTPASALPRGLQSAAVSPVGFADPFNPRGTPTQILGFTADSPTLFSRPIALALDNVLVLASFNLSGPIPETDTSTRNRAVTESLFDALQPGFAPDFRNSAGEALQSVAGGLQATVLTLSVEEAPPAAAPAPAPVLFPDYSERPTELEAFGSTYSAVASGNDLTTNLVRRVALESSDSVSLADLLVANPAGAITDVAIRLQGEGLGDPGGVLKNGGVPVANDIVIDYADLANYTYTAAAGKTLDYLSLIGLSDPGDDGTFDERGSFQTVALSSNGLADDRLDGTTERIQDYTFQTEDGVTFQEVTLTFDNINSLGYTNAKDAIEAGKLRVKIAEVVGAEEPQNLAVTDLYASSGNTIVGRFISPGAENGVTVEVRSLDPAFDIQTVTTRASFG